MQANMRIEPRRLIQTTGTGHFPNSVLQDQAGRLPRRLLMVYSSRESAAKAISDNCAFFENQQGAERAVRVSDEMFRQVLRWNWMQGIRYYLMDEAGAPRLALPVFTESGVD